MHEAGLVEGVLAVVLDVAGDETVERARVRIGRLQHIQPGSFELHWSVLARDTAASEAVVELTETPGDEVVIEEIELAGGRVIRNPALGDVAPHRHDDPLAQTLREESR
ncbi:MAG TPA: hydrogenase/urease maturation nickel metallochaperone HypA [Candidatus Dormibacteraeota bacterium]|jgi:Zn finger protein HypA/HybF involved in hydrogenase expression